MTFNVVQRHNIHNFSRSRVDLAYFFPGRSIFYFGMSLSASYSLYEASASCYYASPYVKAGTIRQVRDSSKGSKTIQSVRRDLKKKQVGFTPVPSYMQHSTCEPAICDSHAASSGFCVLIRRGRSSLAHALEGRLPSTMPRGVPSWALLQQLTI